MKTVLHVGCGGGTLPPYFEDDWKEIRLDIDPDVKPHILSSILAIPVGDETYDAVYSSHNLEHLFRHEVSVALREFRRVLRLGGLLMVAVPDLQSVAKHVAEGNLTDPIYESPAGPIAPIDVLFGHSGCIALGNEFYAHKTGFTVRSLEDALITAGFVDVKVDCDPDAFALVATAYRAGV